MEVKDVCFVRHAKSNWDNLRLSDFDRPLDARGLKDAPMMALKMKKMGLVADFIVTSGAVRAKTTAGYFKTEFDLPASRFLVTNDLYEASAEDVYEVIRQIPDEVRFLYVFGHNPTFTWIANSIAGVHIDNVPTCGVVHAQLISTTWTKFNPSHCGFIGFHYPKQYSK